MKVEIKIKRLLDKIEKMNEEVMSLEQSLVEPVVVDEGTDGPDAFRDHPIPRGVQY